MKKIIFLLVVLGCLFYVPQKTPKVSAQGLPDLVVSSFSVCYNLVYRSDWPPGSKAGADFVYTFKEKNIGDTLAPAHQSAVVVSTHAGSPAECPEPSNYQYDTFDVPVLQPGQEFTKTATISTFQFSWNCSSFFTSTAYADYYYSTNDANWYNNTQWIGPVPRCLEGRNLSYPCPNYWYNCYNGLNGSACPRNTVYDPYGRCQVGKVCCLPWAQPTPTSQSTSRPTPTPSPVTAQHTCYNYWYNCYNGLNGSACPRNTVYDPYGRCQVGKVCCLPR